jgi:peroxiredoxin
MTITLAAEAPPFDLPGVDGESHSLDDYADAPALAVVWSCNHCPYVQAWEGRMIGLQREYADRGFRLVAVSSNDAEAYPEDSFDAMKARAEAEGFNFDYLYDENQSVLNAYGAKRTPEVFLFDRDRRLVYHGAIDDSREEKGVTQEYLRDAIEALLAGDPPGVSETPAVGCTVKRKAH